jgi:hypothetical protein
VISISGIIRNIDIYVIDVINIISLNRLSDGGAAMLAAANKNHHMASVGSIFISPFIKNMFRVWELSYTRFAKENRADDERPCAIIISIAPISPHVVLERAPASISPMWPTDEYAINDLRSGWRRQIILVITAPIIDILTSIDWIFDSIGRFVIIRIMPYPPSFSKIAAKIIDPAIGASTWAFGSHRCVVNRGSFTKNPLIINNLISWLVCDGRLSVDILMFVDNDHLYSSRNIISIGSDAIMVYIIIYILAWTRSGW